MTRVRLDLWELELAFGNPAPLGFYAEHWRPVEDEPDFPALVAEHGRPEATYGLDYYRYRMLREVVWAAGGVECAANRIETLMDEAQSVADKRVARHDPGEPWPEQGRRVHDRSLAEATYEVANLLTWLRTLDERLKRPWKPDPRQSVGLVPSLAVDRPLKARAQTLRAGYRSNGVERRLAAYALHTGVLAQPLAGGLLTRDHKVVLQVPDRPPKRVDWQDELTFEQGRDALSLARDAFEAVSKLVWGLLSGFREDTRAIFEARQREGVSPDVSRTEEIPANRAQPSAPDTA